MLGVTLQETRVYQDALAEGEIIGEAKGKLEMLLMLLNHNFGPLPDNLTQQIEMLRIEQLESLCTAAFDFQNLSDLTTWFNN
jgi:predicted transposase YdaD